MDTDYRAGGGPIVTTVYCKRKLEVTKDVQHFTNGR